jgi:hypothetical protein
VVELGVVSWLLYAAKSTEDRRGSIPTQLEECRAAVEGEGQRRHAGEFKDEAASAYSGNRGPGLALALAKAEQLARLEVAASYGSSILTV